jgi:prepilin-type N-terminal cleavage/methylation domain-containing protein
VTKNIRDRRDDGGFTLIELLIVIVILGILAAIVVFAVSAVTDKGNDAACTSDTKSVEVAVEAYRATNNKYPDGTTSDERYDDLTSGTEKFLREKPSTTNGYTITISDNSGSVTSSPADCNVP